jgi:(1->4)-alpha-D-glucan 1-alpha-D-glucosylmutase
VPDARPAPVSTYRLQLQPGFGFAEAGEAAGYLADLGVTHAYLSPILQAAPGSRHGYDVVDHSRLSADLGGQAAFRAMVGRFRRHGLGVIVDVVPNHMAIPMPESLNRPLWSVLREGAGSPCAHWFDVDWAAQDGRLLLPVLAGPVGDCIGDITVCAAGEQPAAGEGPAAGEEPAPGEGPAGPAAGEPVLRYFGHVLPVRPGTAGLPLAELLAAQHYRLADWRDAATQLNWRRFFDVTSLIAVRVEDPRVFAASHRVLLRLVAEGLIDGLRVDHPDGLADPRGYLARLAAETGGAWVVTEKILSGEERLPADWACAGTTGYDALAAAGGLFVDPAGAAPLTEEYQRFTGGPAEFAPVAEAAKREEASHPLAAEVSRLARLLARADDPALNELGPGDLRTLLVELLTAFPVYRAYVVPGEPAPPAAAAILAQAAAAARRRLPGRLHAGLGAACDLMLGRGNGGGSGQRELIELFQQACGPVMAKGVEDTAFYRWTRLVALNEVGGDPDHFGVTPEQFHGFSGHLARHWPATMTTLSTHDTKRGEDVRARLAALAESARAWRSQLERWHARAVRLSGGRSPEPHIEYLLWQTLVGAWPIDGDRLAAYLRKAMREAKTLTSWTEPDTGYESLVLGFADQVLRDGELAASIAGFAAGLAEDARANSLGAKLVQLTMPGVADTYQGCELGAFSLVDPDNRRPVDFARRRQLLAALGTGTAEPGPAETAAAGLDTDKLLVTSAALRLRREHPSWFAGHYRSLDADGPAARHAVSFLRGPSAGGGPGGPAVTVATRLPGGLRRRGGWADTALPLPGGPWRDVLTGATHAGPRPLLSALTKRLPVALLVPGWPAAGQPGPGPMPPPGVPR